MTTKEELELVLQIMKKHDLPMSPILEYAIREKLEVHTSSEDKDSSPFTDFYKNEEKKDNYTLLFKGKKRKPTGLRIIHVDGTIRENRTSAETFCQTIKEIGIERIYALQIPMDGMTLITKGGNPNYPSAQHDAGNGYFVNVHSNTRTKKRQLEFIFKVFDLSWKVEIVEPK